MDIMMSQSNSKGNMLWKRYRRFHYEQVTAKLDNHTKILRLFINNAFIKNNIGD